MRNRITGKRDSPIVAAATAKNLRFSRVRVLYFLFLLMIFNGICIRYRQACRYVYAVHHIEYAWYLLETFNRTDAEEQKEIKLEVDRIEREYERCVDEWGEW